MEKIKKFIDLPFKFVFQIILWQCIFYWPFKYVIAPLCDWIATHVGLKKVPRSLGLVIVLSSIILFFYGLGFLVPYLLAGKNPPGTEISYSQLITRAVNKEIGEKVVLSQRQDWLIPNKRHAIIYAKVDGKPAWSTIEPQGDVGSPEWFRLHGYDVWMESVFPLSYMMFFGLQMFPNLLLTIFFVWLWAGGGFRSVLGEWSTIKKSSNRFRPPVHFDEIGGLKNAKRLARRPVQMLHDPKHYRRVGAKMPKGLFIWGPKGTGKTMLAIAIATEAKVPYLYFAGSSFRKPLVGLGPESVNNMFDYAIRNMPCVLIIDEFEVAAPSRRHRGPLESTESDANTDTFLSRLDEIEKKDLPILVVAITNYPERVDDAILRSGRFDEHIFIDNPDMDGRIEILKIHFDTPEPLPLDPSLDKLSLIKELADVTSGLSGADLANLTNKARIEAGAAERPVVTREDFFTAVPRILTGSQESDVTLSPAEDLRMREHEAGHGYVSWILKHADHAKLIAAIGFGHSLGINFVPSDIHLPDTRKFLARIKTYLAGYVVEKSIYGEPSAGASRDNERATEIARAMVFSYGMSKLGPIAIDVIHGEQRQFTGAQASSPIVQEAEREIREIIQKCVRELEQLLGGEDNSHMKKIKELASIMEKEKLLTIDRIQQILGEAGQVE